MSSVVRLILILVALVLVNILASYIRWDADLTEDKRYTLTKQTEQLLEEVQDNITIRVLLEEDNLPPDFRRFQGEIRQMLKDFKKINPRIDFEFINPVEQGSAGYEDRLKSLVERGLTPVTLMVNEGSESSTKMIFPYAEVRYGTRLKTIELLQSQSPGEPQEITLLNSTALLEYKFSKAIQRLLYFEKPNVLFLKGHGELDRIQSRTLEKYLRQHYNTARSSLDSLVAISPDIDVVIIAKPTIPFSEKDKFKIDQYLMNNGAVLWLVDRLQVSLDSLNSSPGFVPKELDLNIDDMWFRYGLRQNADLLLDLQCSRIPIAVGMRAGQPDLQMFPWFYHPIINGKDLHPISTNIGRINMHWVNSIDTIKTAGKVRKTPLLQTSDYTRLQRFPMRLGLGMAHQTPDPKLFDKGPQNIAWLVEGEFTSLYKNRVQPEMQESLVALGTPFKEKAQNARMIAVGDGDLAKNLFNPSTQEYSQMGFNKWENFVFGGNKDFLVNCVDYLVSEKGIMTSRSKKLKLKILDKVRAKSEKSKWQFINIGIPLISFVLFGLVYRFLRKRRYTI